MKKILALILALAMIFALGACGSKDVSGTVSPVEDKAAEKPVEEKAEEPAGEAQPSEEASEEGSGDAIGGEEEAAPAEEQKAEEDVTESGAGDAIGGEEDEEFVEDEELVEVISGTRYENESLGIGVALDENWIIYNDEQLAELSGLTADMFSDEKYKEMMESSNTFTDFFAQHNSGASMNVILENLGLVYGTVIDEEQYRSLSLQTLEPAYVSAGFTDIEVEENTIEFAGAERIGVHTHCKVQDIDYYVQQVMIKTGSHMGIVSLCCFVQDDTQFMADMFYSLG